jgi:MFS family permease
MIILGALLMIILGFYDAYWPQVFPLFPPVVFRNVRGVTVVLIGTFLFDMMYYSTAVLWPQHVQALCTTDLIKIGWYASSLGLAGIVSSPIFGWLFTKGHARIMFVFIIALGTIASGTMAVVCE